MGRYQLHEQVWSIEQRGNLLAITDADGTERIEEFATPTDAKRKATIMTNQRLRAGWKLAKDTVAPSPTTRPPEVRDARNPALEAAIIADPRDRGAWLVYGDWLQQQGDPRGTHIALRAASLAAPHDLVAAKRLRDFESRWSFYLGGMLLGAQLGWGFVEAVGIPGNIDVEQLSSDVTRFLTRLTIYPMTDGYLDATLAQVATRASSTLRELLVYGPGPLTTFGPFVDRLAKLEKLELYTTHGPAAVHTLATTPMPQLVELAVAERGGATVVPVLASSALRRLARLYIEANANTALCEALVGSVFVPQLEDLTLFHLDNAGAHVLLAGAERFRALSNLALIRANVDRRTALALDAAFGTVTRADARYTEYSDY